MKPALQGVPISMLTAIAQALEEGKAKYGERSWRTSKESASKLTGAILRHAFAWWSGEEIDPESSSGKSHLAGVAASVAILLDCIYCGTLIDDRPPAGSDAELLRDSNYKASQ